MSFFTKHKCKYVLNKIATINKNHTVWLLQCIDCKGIKFVKISDFKYEVKE